MASETGAGEAMTASDLKALRDKLGLCQEDFAVAIGVSCNQVKLWESGRHKITRVAEKCMYWWWRATQAKNPCDEIFDHKWLDPVCVGKGCQSLVLGGNLEKAQKEIEIWRRENGLLREEMERQASIAANQRHLIARLKLPAADQ